MRTSVFFVAILLFCWPKLGWSQTPIWSYPVPPSPNAGWSMGVVEGTVPGYGYTVFLNRFAPDGTGGGAFLVDEFYGNSPCQSIRVLWLNRRGKLILDSDASASTTYIPSTPLSDFNLSAMVLRVTPAEVVLFVTNTYTGSQYFSTFVARAGKVTRTDIPASETANAVPEKPINDTTGFFLLEQGGINGPLTKISRYSFAPPAL